MNQAPTPVPGPLSAGRTDPRAARTVSSLNAVVLAAVLLTGSPLLLAVQALAFGLGVSGASPYEALYRRVVRPWLQPARRTEPEPPVRFASLVGLVLTTVGTLAAVAGAHTLATAATSAALAAAFLHAALGLCLGCELHLLLSRPGTSGRRTASRRTISHRTASRTINRKGATA